jgi:hypothetical protein
MSAILCGAAAVSIAGLAGAAEPALLIVTPRAWHGAMADYAAKRGGRIAAEVVDLESALAAGKGVDDAERLKQYLYDRWSGSGHAVRYVLLVGDADVMPVRYMVLDRNTAEAFDYAFYPSDLYYADLAKRDGSFEDWNARKDGFHAGYFGEVRGEHFKDDPINFDAIDYRCEVAVGRWPVDSEDEVKIVASKSLAYEAAAAPPTYRGGGGGKPVGPPTPAVAADPAPASPPGTPDVITNAHGPMVALIATGGWMENRPAMDGIASGLKGWTLEKRYWPGGGREDKTPPPNEAQVVSLLNSGAMLVLHSGHGADDQWAGSLGMRGLKQISNADHPAVMMSAGCSTARFATLPPYESYTDVDSKEHAGTNNGEKFTAPPPPPACYQKGAHNLTGLGEQLLRAGPNGAAVYIGCNTGSQPCGMTLMEGFAGGIAAGKARVGDCWVAAIDHYWEAEHLAEIKPTPDWYPASIFFQGMKFMVFGDPSLPVPTATN